MWIFLGILLLILLLLWLAVELEAEYQTGDQPTVTLRYLFFTFRLLPQKEKPEKPKKAKKEKPAQEASAAPPKKEKKGKLPETSELLALAKEFLPPVLSRLRWLLRTVLVKKLLLHMSVGGADAADAAQKSGKLNFAVYTAYATAQNIITLRKPDICILPNYLSEETRVKFQTKVRIRPIQVLGVAFSLAGALLHRLLRMWLLNHKTKKTKAIKVTNKTDRAAPTRPAEHPAEAPVQ